MGLVRDSLPVVYRDTAPRPDVDDKAADRLYRESWRRDARCLNYPDVAFIPRRGVATADAKAVCAWCRVQADCLAYALADPDLVGIWGGTTSAERIVLRRQQRLLTER